jgi:hypothetical protein
MGSLAATVSFGAFVLAPPALAPAPTAGGGSPKDGQQQQQQAQQNQSSPNAENRKLADEAALADMDDVANAKLVSEKMPARTIKNLAFTGTGISGARFRT